MADLPTNYYDDILSASMNGKKKFRLTYRNGTTEEVTIEDISEYDQYGSKFGAGDINKTNQAVNEKFDSGDVVDPMLTTEPGFAADAYQTKLQFDEQNKNMGGLRFGVDADGNYGYIKDGADTVTPFKKGYEDTPGTATAADITVGKTAWVNGKLIPGTRPLPVNKQSGSVTFMVSAATSSGSKTTTYLVPFQQAFDKVPSVSVGLTSHGSNLFTISAINITQTSFYINVVNHGMYGSENVTFNWVAQSQ